MAIEKRKLPSGKIVGFDTKRKCYCELPKEMKNSPAETDFYAFTNAQLDKLADEQGIDLDGVTRKDDKIAKIKEGLAKQSSAGPLGQ